MAALVRRKALRLATGRGPLADHPFNRQQNRAWRNRIPMSLNAPSAGRPVADRQVEEARAASRNRLSPEISDFAIEKPFDPH